MKDLSVALEAILILALPFIPIAAGILLRRKFAPPAAEDGAGPAGGTGAQKAGRLAGTILLWCGILAALFMVIVAMNFKGWI